MNHTLSPEHFIFTPEAPKGPTKFGKNPSIEDVTGYLNNQGERAEIVEGHYGQPERSILVHNPKNVKGLHQMAHDFGQESAIHSKNGNHELHFYHGPNAGKIVKGKGTTFQKEKPDDNYTTIHTADGPLHFTHNFDFSKSENLNKVQIIPSKAAKPKQIKLQEGGNKGKIVDVAGDLPNEYRIEAKTNSAPVQVIGTGGVPRPINAGKVAVWDKNRKHKVISEEKPKTNGAHIFESNDVHPFMEHTPKQKKLVNGIDIKKIHPNMDGWTTDWAISGKVKNSAGKNSIVKGRMPSDKVEEEGMGSEYEDLTTAQREGLYHNLAHVMGLGKYVPTTSVLYDKADPERQGPSGNHYSVMEMIPGAGHWEGNEEQQKHLKNARDKGDVDKLAIMNTLLGNTDRHNGNWMISPKGIHMIDHGLTFDWHGKSGRSLNTPAYFEEAYRDSVPESMYGPNDNNLSDIPIHPEAVKWLDSMNPKDFQEFFKKHKVKPQFIKPLMGAIQTAKDVVDLHRDQKLSTMDVMRAIRKHYQGPNNKYRGSRERGTDD